MSIVVGLYILLLVLAVVALWILLRITRNQRAPYCVALFTLNTVVLIANLALATANNAGEALMATKFTYFTGTFGIFLIALSMCEICKIRIPFLLKIFLIIMNSTLLTIVFMAGHNSLYYKSYEMIQQNGYTYLAKEYGPVHGIFGYSLVIGILVMIGMVLYSAIKQTTSWIYIALLNLAGAINVGIYFLQRALNIQMELSPFGLIILEYIMLFILNRMMLYDMSYNVQLSIARSKDMGFAIFNNDLKYISSDEVARKFFPEINHLRIDRAISDPFLRKEFSEWMLESKDNPVEAKYYLRNDIDIKVMTQPLLDNSGKKQLGYMLQISNDTKNQQYIRGLKEANERANEMAQSAKKANNAKSEFLSNMSHEIRTPMNAVLGMNEMIMRETDNPQIKEYAANIDNSGKMLLSIINDILDFSKIEAGKMDIIPTEYDLARMLYDLDNMNRPRAEEKNLKFEIKADETLPKKLLGDTVRIKQIVTNLISNAIKYTDEGNVTIEVKSEGREGDSLNLFFAVQDTGKGIRPEDQTKLFKSFQRIDEKSNRSIEGTGLGLVITQGLVDLMGGNIGVESKFTEGSLFYVSIPQTVTSEEALGDYRTAGASITSGIRPYKQSFTAPDAHVLIVDDTSVNIVVFKGLLKKTELKIDSALSGREALELCRNNKYDILFIDHMMPEMDGIELLKELAGAEYAINKDAPRIALTANALSGSREMYLGAGFDDYLSKPMNSAELENLVRQYLPKEKVEY